MSPSNQKHWRRLGLALLSGLCLLVWQAVPSRAQISQAQITEILDSGAAFIDGQPAQVQDVAAFRQTASTGAARATLTFNTGAVGRLAAHSALVVGQCIEIEQGELLVSGPANGCVAGFEVAVEGTIYVLGVDAEGQGDLRVLEGTVSLRSRQQRDRPLLRLQAGQRVRWRRDNLSGTLRERLGRPERLTHQEFVELITGRFFRGFRRSLRGQSELRRLCQQLYPEAVCPEPGRLGRWREPASDRPLRRR